MRRKLKEYRNENISKHRVTVLINEKDGVRAMNAVHDAFNLAD